MDRDRISVGFINISGARINESTPVVNHLRVGIYLKLPVEIVRASFYHERIGPAASGKV
jgi:hypothetical protein